MITHEEARIASMLTTVEASRIMIDYISQQEKVTELLGLYQAYHNEPLDEEYCFNILIKIEQLEKEIEELK